MTVPLGFFDEVCSEFLAITTVLQALHIDAHTFSEPDPPAGRLFSARPVNCDDANPHCNRLRLLSQAWTVTFIASAGLEALVAALALDGPPKCSGLDVVRYSPESLSAEVGQGFELVEALDSVHVTSASTKQPFIYCRFARPKA